MISSKCSIHTALCFGTRNQRPPIPPTKSTKMGEERQLKEPTSAAARRVAQKAAVASRNDFFHQLYRMGVNAIEANRKANEKYDVLKQNFAQRVQRNMADAGRQQKESFSELETRAKEHIDWNMDLFDDYTRPQRQQKHRSMGQYPLRQRHVVGPDPSTPKYFTPNFEMVAKHQEMGLDFSRATEHRLEFWRDWDRRAAEIANQAMGPRNAFEEQMEWTRRGKLWPYPIDNEWRIGQEENTSFVDHLFLEPELGRHKIPRSKPVDHFMELVLVGLSKNPYMSVAKKHEHIAWYADYFKTAMKGKYRQLLIKEK